MKVRFGDGAAIDLAQVIAWKKVKALNSSTGTEILRLVTGANSDFSVASNEIGRPAFDRLHQLLLDQFSIDLAKNYSISNSCASVDEPLDLPF